MSTESPSKRIIKRIIAIAVTLAVLGALAYPKLKSEGNTASGMARPGGPDTLLVDAFVTGPTTMRDRILTTGTIRANEAVDLVSEASGKLTDILFEEGTYVEKGQLLVKINDADLLAQRERATYRLKLAEEREARQRQILEKGGISREQYDETLNEVNVLKAEIQLIDAQIAKTEIRAPFSGIVGLRYVSEGSYISPQTRIATLQQLNPVKVDFSVPEQYSGQMKIGGTIQYRVEGSDQVYTGRIYAIEPRVSQDTRTLELRALTPNPGGTLVPGAFANIEVVLNELNEALAIPAIAVVPELNGKKVFVYKNGRAESRPIETGIRTATDIQVLSGLAPGDTVITTGLQLIRPGMPVKLTMGNE